MYVFNCKKRSSFFNIDEIILIPNGDEDKDGQDGEGDDSADDPEVNPVAEEDRLKDDRRVEVRRLTRRCTIGARTTSGSCNMPRFIIKSAFVCNTHYRV